jgi:hypothetical protein
VGAGGARGTAGGLVLLVALLAGVLVAVSLLHEQDAYAARHRQVTAQVVDERAIVARVTWDDGQAGGWARRPLERVSDTTVRIWLDAQGRIVPRPIGAAEVGFGFLLAAVVAGAATWLCACRELHPCSSSRM